MDYKVTTAPQTEPVTLVEAKLHLRVDHSADDDLITSLIVAAREYCEHYQNRAYIEQTITARLDSFSKAMVLPMPPLISVSSVKYYDSAGDQQTLSSDLYDVDVTSEPGLVTLGYNDSYPTIQAIHHSIEIIYKAGYGSAASSVPETIKAAMKLLIGHLYENRQTVSAITLKEVPMAVKSLLSIDRIVPV